MLYEVLMTAHSIYNLQGRLQRLDRRSNEKKRKVYC